MLIHGVSDEEVAIALENAETTNDTRCSNHAPFIAFTRETNAWYLVQGCCNSWYCPRCSIIRAKHEYGRIVHGANTLAIDHGLFFVTLTCDSTYSASDGDENYLQYTNRVLTAWRTHTKTHGGAWHYVQVTERQKRGHPHSHIIATSIPDDTIPVSKGDWSFIGYLHNRDELYSQWLTDRCISSGLGAICNISEVRSSHGVASYVAKYLFKDLSQTQFPKHWKRIRYSQSWPKLPQKENAPENAFPVIRASDWNRVRELPVIRAMDNTSYETALAALCMNIYPPNS